jgi:hypothetical protein
MKIKEKKKEYRLNCNEKMNYQQLAIQWDLKTECI